MHRPSDVIRLALLGALGVPGCTTVIQDAGDTADTTDTGTVDDSGDDGPGDTGLDSGDDTSDDSGGDSGDSGDSGDTADTGNPDDSGDSGDTDTGCGSNPPPDAEAQWTTHGWLGWGQWTVCLDASVGFQDAGCTPHADVAGRVDDIMTPDCIYSDTDTGIVWWPTPLNPPCDDGLTFFDSITCGPFEGAGGTCCFEVQLSQVAIGRPLWVDGALRLAPTTAGPGWTATGSRTMGAPSEAAQAWLAIARAEHASVASFARVVLDLLAHGAPADLVADATRAQADEIRHAQQAFALAHHLGAPAHAPGALPMTGLTVRETLEDVLIAAIHEGCVGETLAAHEAAVGARHATDPAVREALTAIAEDETRHAALAWRMVRWVLDQRPDLHPAAEAAFDTAIAEARARPVSDSAVDLSAWGVLTGQAARDATHEALATIVAPCREALAA